MAAEHRGQGECRERTGLWNEATVRCVFYGMKHDTKSDYNRERAPPPVVGSLDGWFARSFVRSFVHSLLPLPVDDGDYKRHGIAIRSGNSGSSSSESRVMGCWQRNRNDDGAPLRRKTI